MNAEEHVKAVKARLAGPCFGAYSEDAPECRECVVEGPCRERYEQVDLNNFTCYGSFDSAVRGCMECPDTEECRQETGRRTCERKPVKGAPRTVIPDAAGLEESKARQAEWAAEHNATYRCVDNKGLEGSFEVGVEYLEAQTCAVRLCLDLYDRYGGVMRVSASQFELSEPSPDDSDPLAGVSQGCAQCKHFTALSPNPRELNGTCARHARVVHDKTVEGCPAWASQRRER